MKEYVSQGKNVDQAIDNGLRMLNLNREDVDIKILEVGGLFKKAKVVLQYEEPKEEETVQPTLSNIEENANKEEKIEDQPILKETNNVEKEQPEQINCEEKEIVSSTELKVKVDNFLTELLNKMGVNASFSLTEDGNTLNYEITGENLGKLIGYKGETLNALQYLLGSLKAHNERKFRIFLDVDGYKKNSNTKLVELANRMADKAEEIERNVHLDPMTPYERRIIHTTLASRSKVATESMGEGNKRHVVIKFIG